LHAQGGGVGGSEDFQFMAFAAEAIAAADVEQEIVGVARGPLEPERGRPILVAQVTGARGNAGPEARVI
jgi:hypothetical protein